ncbi:MAG: phosphatidate cytidylyltransferase [Pseudomonadota bacterium]
MLTARVVTAAVILPVFVGSLLWLPNGYWAVFLLPMLLAGAWEWAALVGYQRRGRWLFSGCVLLSSLGMMYLSSGIDRAAAGHLPVVVISYWIAAVFWLALVPLWLLRGWRLSNPLAMAVAGWIVLVPSWLAMARLQEQPLQLLILLGIVWIADSAAYLTGKKLGRHKLAPVISPGKTWEGVAGAVFGVAVYYAVLLSVFTHVVGMGKAAGMATFAVLTIASIEGDLFESCIKRQAGVKDSGNLLPGHGGVLDRIDGLTASMPLAALILQYAA